MLALDRMRTIEVLDPSGGWISGHYSQLEEGDIFRINEPDGSPSINKHGRREFRCMAQPFVQCDPLDHQPEPPLMLSQQPALRAE